MKKTLAKALLSVFLASLFAASASASALIAIADDPTNAARAIKLLETAGFIKVDPAVGYAPEIKDVTEYIYDIEIVPVAANTLPSTLDDFTASAVNVSYAIPAGLSPSRDGLITEKQKEGDDNPFICFIAARTADKDNPVYKKIADAYHAQVVAEYILTSFDEVRLPVFDYNPDFKVPEGFVESINSYVSDPKGKQVVKVGVCGSSNEEWNAVQKVLDERGENIYIELVEFAAFNLPNEALNSGDIDINAFQHRAFLAKEIATQGYDITPIGNTYIGPLTLYSHRAKTLDELKEIIGKK